MARARRPANPPEADATTEASAETPSPPAPRSVGSSWRTLTRALSPRASRAQLLAGLLCALVGFALVVQVQQNRSDGLSTLRQDDLVRVLDEVTQRAEELQEQAVTLRATRNELATGSDTRQAALEAAAERAGVHGILAGRLPAQGPGVELVIRESGETMPAMVLYNILEELRNAGAEAVQVDDLRLTASSYFVDRGDGVEVDGELLEPPYRWLAIGDPEVLTPALNMPGGALAVVRSAGGTADLRESELVEITAVRDLERPEFATPVPAPEGD